jgi:hypothetical protein
MASDVVVRGTDVGPARYYTRLLASKSGSGYSGTLELWNTGDLISISHE